MQFPAKTGRVWQAALSEGQMEELAQGPQMQSRKYVKEQKD